jgi:hypothetical protein
MTMYGLFGSGVALSRFYNFAAYMGVSGAEATVRFDAQVAEGGRIRTVQNGCVVYYRRGGRNARA